MLTVVTPAASRLLSTPGRVKREIGVTTIEHSQWVNDKLAEVSDIIATFCGRSFGRETVAETFRFSRGCAGDITLSRSPLVSVASVNISGTALGHADYELDAEQGVLRRLNGNGYPVQWGYGSTVVTYVAGWLLPGETGRDLPRDIEAAALTQIKQEWFAKGRDPLVRSESIPGVRDQSFWVGSLGPEDTGALHPDAARLLDPYRFPRVG